MLARKCELPMPYKQLANHIIACLFALAFSACGSLARAQDAKTLETQAYSAYERKDFDTSAALFEKAIAAGDHSAGIYYDAACSHALAGNRDRAFANLGFAVEAGYAKTGSLIYDNDLKSLQSDPRWQSVIDRMDALHPEQPYLRLLEDQSRSIPSRYLPVRRAIANGLQPPPFEKSHFLQFYGVLASMSGDYDVAHRFYLPNKAPDPDPMKLGFDHAVPANAQILRQARGRQAVFLNESHGDAQTRAANYTLLAPLRKQGFKYLALETLARVDPEPSGPTACSAPRLGDADLPSRGYPVHRKTGYYTSEPVYGEIIREAIRLGFTLVSYDNFSNLAPREQHQAEMLHCLFKADPKAKVLVIAGFSHIAEDKESGWGGGMMAYRFKALTGIDPLTVNMSDLTNLDSTQLAFPKADDGRGAQAYALVDKSGAAYGSGKYDLMLYVRYPAHRNDPGGSWLELGGARKRTPIATTACREKVPCLLEARAMGEGSDAIPSDRCVVGNAGEAACNLYLRPGQYRIVAVDEAESLLTESDLTVR